MKQVITNNGHLCFAEFYVDSSYIEPFAGHFLESEDEFKTMLQNQRYGIISECLFELHSNPDCIWTLRKSVSYHSGSQFEGSALQLPLSCGMEASAGSDVHETSDDDPLLPHQRQQDQHHQDHLSSSQRQLMEFGGEKEDRKPYDHVMGWNTTEFLSNSVRANNILSISDSSLGELVRWSFFAVHHWVRKDDV